MNINVSMGKGGPEIKVEPILSLMRIVFTFFTIINIGVEIC